MSQKVLFIELLLVHYTTQSLVTTVTASCNDDVPLQCSSDMDSMKFLSVTWYKINPTKNGIIRRGYGDVTTQRYNFSRPADFGEKYSLLLLRVTPKDSGSYECSISANIGGQNKNFEINLIVKECVTQADLTTMPNVLNTSHSNQLCHNQAEDLPVMWIIIIYVAVGLAKIILSLISIWVIRALCTRSSRRWQSKWGR